MMDDIPEHMIPTTFNKKTEYSSYSNLNSLIRHHTIFY
jgi:hypothetical protein